MSVMVVTVLRAVTLYYIVSTLEFRLYFTADDDCNTGVDRSLKL